MKRKIYQTKYGRVMLKIQTVHKDNYCSVLTIQFNDHIECLKGKKFRMGFQYENRRIQNKVHKSLNQNFAEYLAKTQAGYSEPFERNP